MRLRVLDIKDVAETHLCCGCGICGFLDPKQVTIVDDLGAGRRPMISGTPVKTTAHQAAFAACPGRRLAHDYDREQPGLIRELEKEWGPVLGVWEGYATDPLIRFSGSSGGVATALAAFAMEEHGFSGALHIAARQDVPYLNETVMSTTREQLLSRSGSRYAPASPCDSLHEVEAADGPCVFIGKPCDVAGTFQARKQRPELASKIGLTIGIFCAGTPSTRGTLAVLRAMGIEDPSSVRSIRYRGNGWPGKFAVEITGPSGLETREMTYRKSWGEILQKHRQWRCHICPDHTGEFADISVGDPWHEPPAGDEPGRNLVVARTKRGMEIVERAIQLGMLTMHEVRPKTLPESQSHLLNARVNVWPRLAALTIMGAATPTYRRFWMKSAWVKHVPLGRKPASVASTIKRVIRRKLTRRRPIEAWVTQEALEKASA